MRARKISFGARGVCAALAVLVGLPWLAACSVSDPQVTIGKDFPVERRVAIRRGTSTKKQVEELLGKPYRVIELEGRRQRWRYYSREEAVQQMLFFFPTKTYVTKHEVLVTFDGAFVESVEHSSQNHVE